MLLNLPWALLRVPSKKKNVKIFILRLEVLPSIRAKRSQIRFLLGAYPRALRAPSTLDVFTFITQTIKIINPSKQ